MYKYVKILPILFGFGHSTIACLNIIPRLTWGAFRVRVQKIGDHFEVNLRISLGVGGHFGRCTYQHVLIKPDLSKRFAYSASIEKHFTV